MLKDKEDEPIGSLTLHFSPAALGYELFTLDGTRLFHSNQVVARWVDDYLDQKFTESEFSIWENARTTKLEDLTVFEENPELWLQFLLMKAMLYRNYAINKE